MIDIELLRNNFDQIFHSLNTRGFELDKNLFSSLERERKLLQSEIQALQELRNKTSKEIGFAIKQGQDITDIKKKVEDANNRLKSLLHSMSEVNAKLENFLNHIPNIPHPSVPVGASEDDNVELAKCGKIKKFSFTAKDHIELVEAKKLYDNSDAIKISGARFSVLKGDLARLHRALAQFMIDFQIQENGYTEVNVPTIVNQQSLFGTGQLPKFEEDIFQVLKEEKEEKSSNNNYYLIPTAEVPLTNLVANSILKAKDLPLNLASHSCCYRSEAGSYGKDVRGFIRQHQFEKVELVKIVEAEKSFEALEQLCKDAESILIELELPYRKIALCTGDLGFSACKTYDLEVWLPSQNTYREISSCSNTGDFQARRMKARYKKSQDSKTQYVHSLNGSGLAVGRTLVAILENYQQENGDIELPKVLHKYMGGKTFI